MKKITVKIKPLEIEEFIIGQVISRNKLLDKRYFTDPSAAHYPGSWRRLVKEINFHDAIVTKIAVAGSGKFYKLQFKSGDNVVNRWFLASQFKKEIS